jgi:tetratricopeptide (TPR) repeat protein
MKLFMARAAVLAALVVGFVAIGRAQYDEPIPQPSSPPAQQTPAQKGPTINKQEVQAYNKVVVDQKSGDPAKIIAESEAFLEKYPKSIYGPNLYGQLTVLYFSTGQVDKMMDAGNKALAVNPDNVDVLPLFAMAVSRGASKAQDPKAELLKAETYGKHGIEVLNAMAKPDTLDDATFEKTKSDRLAWCHSALGLVAFNRNKYDDAVVELNQAVKLASAPDPVDYYLLGKADVVTNHFIGSIDAFSKCSATGPLQAPCKAGMEDAKKKQQTGLEAPQ